MLKLAAGYDCFGRLSCRIGRQRGGCGVMRRSGAARGSVRRGMQDAWPLRAGDRGASAPGRKRGCEQMADLAIGLVP